METNPSVHRIALGNSVRYTIRVAGRVEGEWTDWLDAEIHTARAGNQNAPVTVITGLFDQAALHGLLRRCYSLGFPLISVTPVEPAAEEQSPGQAGR